MNHLRPRNMLDYKTHPAELTKHVFKAKDCETWELDVYRIIQAPDRNLHNFYNYDLIYGQRDMYLAYEL